MWAHLSILPLHSELVRGYRISHTLPNCGNRKCENDMCKESSTMRTLTVKIRVSQQEKESLKKFQQKTTEKSLSNYLRKQGLQKPITVLYRNESADDFLREMISLKKQLSGIGNNFNQAVHKLHTLDHIPEFRNWIIEQQALQQQVIAAIEQIRNRIHQLYEQWLQK